MTGDFRTLEEFGVAPGASAGRVGEHREERRDSHCISDCFAANERLPRFDIRGDQAAFPRGLVPVEAAKAYEEILEGEKGMTDSTFRPVQENASTAAHDYIAGIEIEVVNRVGHFGISRQTQGCAHFRGQLQNVLSRELLRPLYGCLGRKFHHYGEERIAEFAESATARIETTDIEEMQGLAEGGHLQFGQRGRDSRPEIDPVRFRGVCTLGFGGEPSVPLLEGGDNVWQITGKIPGQRHRNRVLAKIRRSDGLEPYCRAIGLKPGEAECRARIDLGESSAQVHSQRKQPTLDPVRETVPPAGRCEWGFVG